MTQTAAETIAALAKEQLATTGHIDWANMQAQVEAQIAADKQEETEAALEEGLAPMPEDLIALREEKLALDEEIDRLTARKSEIKDIFGKRIDDEGLKGFVLNGKVHARVSHGTRHTVDSQKLKAEMPHIWSRFLKTTPYRSVTVN